jgi:hypothetical protein
MFSTFHFISFSTPLYDEMPLDMGTKPLLFKKTRKPDKGRLP